MELYIIITLSITAICLAVLVISQSGKVRRLYKEKTDLLTRKATLEAQLEAKDETFRQLNEQRDKAEAAQAEQKAKDLENMKDAFKALAAENAESFNRKSSESIAQILKPVEKKFEDFDKAVRESQNKNVEQSASLKTLIEQVMERSNKVGEEANKLSNALTGYSKVQGDFGEMLLVDVLKNSGLVEGQHFVAQRVITDEAGHEVKSDTGGTMIPDVMVLYPDETTVIIDSKVSLNSYKEYMNADTVEEKKHFAKEHVRSVRSHVDELKKKDYASYIPDGKKKVDYNIMFIPMEGAFRLMLEEEPMLWQVAKDNNVLIVSQMTLVIVLNMIQMSWRQYSQERNIADVYRTAEELMSQLKGWMESYVKIGRNLETAAQAYEESKKKLVESNQSVIKKIEKLERLGASPKKSGGKLKPGARMVMGKESIIPSELTPAPEEGTLLEEEQ